MQPQYIPALTPAEIERFWSKVDRNGPIPEYAPHLGPCWLWTGSLNVGGYGMVTVKVDCREWRNRPAHRIALCLNGTPVPDGLVPDHLCRVRHCVRPSHLESVTQTVNILRGQGASALNAAKVECIRGHNDWVVRKQNNRRCQVCKRADDLARRTKRREAREGKKMPDLGERLAKARQDSGLTQAAVAKAAGISMEQLANIEAGRSRPSVDNFAFICQVIGVKMDDFYWSGWHD